MSNLVEDIEDIAGSVLCSYIDETLLDQSVWNVVFDLSIIRFWKEHSREEVLDELALLDLELSLGNSHRFEMYVLYKTMLTMTNGGRNIPDAS